MAIKITNKNTEKISEIDVFISDYKYLTSKRDKLKRRIYRIEVSKMLNVPGPATLVPIELLKEELESLNKLIETLEKKSIIECIPLF